MNGTSTPKSRPYRWCGGTVGEHPGAGPEVPQADQLRLAEQLGGALAAGDVRARRSGGMDADQRALGENASGGSVPSAARATPPGSGSARRRDLSLAAAVVQDQRDAALVAQAIDGLPRLLGGSAASRPVLQTARSATAHR